MGHRILRSPESMVGQFEQVVVVANEQGDLVGSENGRLKVIPGGNGPDDPVYVTNTNGRRIYYRTNAVNSESSAEITSTLTCPYTVGGQDLTITIDGEATPTVVSFPARVAQGGYLYGGTYPALKYGFPNRVDKMKVSVDGGELTEIQIADTYMDFDSIAAAIQTEIRANVPNGSGVVVAWNSPQFPYRFAMWSATTGSGSSIHCEGNYLAKELKLSAGYGLVEVAGLDADTYLTSEVHEFLDSGLHDVDIQDDPLMLTTRNGGTSASLQVAAGGANDALGFPTDLVTGQAGTGSDNMIVDASSADARYEVPVQDGRVFVVEELVLLMRAKSAELKKFGGIDELVNGILIEFRLAGQPSRVFVEARTNSEMLAHADVGEVTLDSHADGNDLIKATFVFIGGLRLVGGTMDSLHVTIRDNLTDVANMFYFNAIAKGWLEA